MTDGDVWNGSCPERAADHANCADTDSPDFDFAASPMLAELDDGLEILVAAQKSGLVYGLDPDREGRVVWQYDTVRDYESVNGVKANGGSINNGGPAVAAGMLFTNSGYSHQTGITPGNVLLAFGIE